MAPAAEVDLYAPFERDTILEVRTSKMKTMPGLKIQTGIDKSLRSGRVPVSSLGLDADEHDLTFHGGRDKAIHGYCSSHYPAWRAEYPEAAARFRPGGFGENFVTARMNERNVCIGDVMSVGPPGSDSDPDSEGVLLQVSLPRQPCFKLNHRFQLKNFAPNTYRTSRTGWYYRVLRSGGGSTVGAGDEIRLVERRWPAWTVERVQEYLHRNTDDAEMNEALAGVVDMGDESRRAFEGRVAKWKARQKRRAAGPDEKEAETWRDFRIVEKTAQTPRITSFVLEACGGGSGGGEGGPEEEEAGNDDVKLGSHARLKLPNGLLRSYSIVSGTPNRFELGVALESPSRGGSAWLHRDARVGDVLQVGRVTTDVKPAGAASTHVFVVGGVGLTAFLSMMEAYRDIHWETVVHYGVRSAAADVPFRARVDALRTADSVSVNVYDGSAEGGRMDIPAIFETLPWNSHVYVCGPRRMMDEAAAEARRRGLGEDEVHFEAFAADTTGDPFEAEVGDRGGSRVLQVGGEETLLEVLRRHFDDVPSSCEVGNCGTCKVALKAGRVEHRGTALLDEEKAEAMLSCVSRGMGRIAIEI